MNNKLENLINEIKAKMMAGELLKQNEYKVYIDNTTELDIDILIGDNELLLHLTGCDILNAVEWLDKVYGTVIKLLGIDGDKFGELYCQAIIDTDNMTFLIYGYSITEKYLILTELLR